MLIEGKNQIKIQGSIPYDWMCWFPLNGSSEDRQWQREHHEMMMRMEGRIGMIRPHAVWVGPSMERRGLRYARIETRGAVMLGYIEWRRFKRMLRTVSATERITSARLSVSQIIAVAEQLV
mgnify:FL=1